MPIINLANPLMAILCLVAIICAIYLGYEVKKAVIPGVALALCILLLIVYSLQLFVFTQNYEGYEHMLSVSMVFDFGFILLTYLSYLWIDAIEAKHRNKKSIDNSLDWFWSKIV